MIAHFYSRFPCRDGPAGRFLGLNQLLMHCIKMYCSKMFLGKMRRHSNGAIVPVGVGCRGAEEQRCQLKRDSVTMITEVVQICVITTNQPRLDLVSTTSNPNPNSNQGRRLRGTGGDLPPQIFRWRGRRCFYPPNV